MRYVTQTVARGAAWDDAVTSTASGAAARRSGPSMRGRAALGMLLLALVTLAGVLAGAARAHSVIDQQQPVFDTSAPFVWALGGYYRSEVAQIVTPGITGDLTEVRFPAKCETTLTVEVQGVSGGLPDGVAAGSQTVPFLGPLDEFNSIVFSKPVPVRAGTPYALVLSTSGECGILPGPVGDPYPGGDGYGRGDGDPWVPLGVVPERRDLPFQALVDRHVVSTCSVKNVQTGGSFSDLQAAIDDASAGSTLKIQGTCFGNYTIDESLNLVGLLSWRGMATLDGNDAGTVLTVSKSTTIPVVVITNLRIINGTGTDGGGINNDGGRVTLNGLSSVSGNTAEFGGGISNDHGGSVILNGLASVSGNTVGGIRNSSGNVTLNDFSSVRGNTGGGIFNHHNDSSVTLNDHSSVSGNTAEGGGGISNQKAGTVILNGFSSVRGNTASYDGGGIANGPGGSVTLNDRSSVQQNHATDGGGIHNYVGMVTLNDRSSVRKNAAGNQGGGIYNDGGDLYKAIAGVNVYANTPDDIYPPPVP
jgi:hypothetical protein